MGSYDRADWHYGGDFPKDLRNENGGTHIGMFLAWIIQHDLYGELHVDSSQKQVVAVKDRQMTGREFLFEACDEKFWEEDLSEEGNRFAKAYYAGAEGKAYGRYIDDYERTLAVGLDSIYRVEDSWANYDRLSLIISQRYLDWKKYGSVDGPAKPWWKFWR